MVNPDCFLTREQSQSTFIRVTFQVVLGNGKWCIFTSVHTFYYTLQQLHPQTSTGKYWVIVHV